MDGKGMTPNAVAHRQRRTNRKYPLIASRPAVVVVRVFGGAQVVLLLTSQSQNPLSNVV